MADVLKQFSGLDASLYGAAFVLAVLLRFARAYWYHFGDPQTIAAAAFLGMGGAIVNLASAPHTWQFIVWQGITLIAAVMALEFTLRKLSRKLAWLPGDNEKIPPRIMREQNRLEKMKHHTHRKGAKR